MFWHKSLVRMVKVLEMMMMNLCLTGISVSTSLQHLVRSFYRHQLHTFLHPIIVFFLQHMPIPLQPTPRPRQITTPVPHLSVFYRPDALPAAQPTASKHWRRIATTTFSSYFLNACHIQLFCPTIWLLLYLLYLSVSQVSQHSRYRPKIPSLSAVHHPLSHHLHNPAP